MHRILVAVDGSAHSDRAVSYAIRLAESNESAETHLLNVQPEMTLFIAKIFASKGMIEDYYRDEGEKAVESAKRLLDGARAPYKLHSAVGNAPEVIARYAKELNCDAIVMGTRGLGSMVGLVLGSVATKVLYLAEVPVTLVK